VVATTTIATIMTRSSCADIQEATCGLTPVHWLAQLTLTKSLRDGSTIRNFRHLPGLGDLAPELLRQVNAHPEPSPR